MNRLINGIVTDIDLRYEIIQLSPILSNSPICCVTKFNVSAYLEKTIKCNPKGIRINNLFSLNTILLVPHTKTVKNIAVPSVIIFQSEIPSERLSLTSEINKKG